MRNRVLAFAVSALLCIPAPIYAQASEDPDEIVRLPGQGVMRTSGERPGKDKRQKTERLVPGGSLFVSFDKNEDGIITPEELKSGAEAAFLVADTNEDSFLSALEQISWAETLIIRDDTLSNPAYFDPNLDRMVSHEEFMHVINVLAEDYAEETGEILVKSLHAPKQDRERRKMSRLMPDEPLGN
ncbi:EF-hand domain-containing protein [Hyphomonas pacifica]|nr:hypothetical protein [Hyphomonas pacifica]KCZ52999.1 hypothetical protein HY2_00310 [Hyphomonas pacifica]